MTPEEKIKQFKDKYGSTIKKITNEATRETGEMALDLLYLRTKSGQGTNGDLKSLSKSYREFRERWSSFLADDTSPSESNLTATGQLLDALFLRVVGSRFFIKVNSKNRQEGLGGENLEEIKKDIFKKVNGKRTKVGSKVAGYQSRLTNDDVRKFVEDAGRVFLEFNDKEKEEIRKFATDLLREKLSDIINR